MKMLLPNFQYRDVRITPVNGIWIYWKFALKKKMLSLGMGFTLVSMASGRNQIDGCQVIVVIKQKCHPS